MSYQEVKFIQWWDIFKKLNNRNPDCSEVIEWYKTYKLK